MYPVGVLFGLGFDTATEVGVLRIAATQSAAGVPALSIVVFPALFTAAMSFIDTAAGSLGRGQRAACSRAIDLSVAAPTGK